MPCLYGNFPQKSPVNSGSFAERDLRFKASYAYLPPCNPLLFLCIASCIYAHTHRHTYMYMYVHINLRTHTYIHTSKYMYCWRAHQSGRICACNTARCNALQHTATYWSAYLRVQHGSMQHAAKHRNILIALTWHFTTHYSTLQHAVTRMFIQHTRTETINRMFTGYNILTVLTRPLTSHCNTLQHIATHCNTLQHIATHCNTLQHAIKRMLTGHKSGRIRAWNTATWYKFSKVSSLPIILSVLATELIFENLNQALRSCYQLPWRFCDRSGCLGAFCYQ